MSALNDLGNKMDYDAKSIFGRNGSKIWTRAPQLESRFCAQGALNSDAPQQFVQTETGTGVSHAIWAPSTSVAGGAAVGVAGATTHNAEELAGKSVVWVPASMGGNVRMVAEWRFKGVGATTATDGTMVVGWADAVTYASGLAFTSNANSTFATTAPVEFVGLYYSSVPSSGALFNSAASGAIGNFWGVMSMKNSVAGTLAVATNPAGSVAKDSGFHIVRVEMDNLANAAIFYDDVQVGTVSVATTAATALTPYLSIISENSHALTGTCSFIKVGGDLV